MVELLNPILIARIQYAFTISFHIIFPSFTIGLASWLAIIEWFWLKTRKPIYQEIYKMWIKVFAICFAIGVVSGIVMAYQFGTNWSIFSQKAANIIGPLLGYEVLTAFFLEASFLGIMLFGWGRVSHNMHFFSTCIVAIGTLISAFWILSANSWMQTPEGFKIGPDGLFYPTSWLKIIFNPSFPYRFAHMLTAAYLTTNFTIAGVASYYLLKNIYTEHARVMLKIAMFMTIFTSPLQLFIGDLHGLNTLKYQPCKLASMEGIWNSEKGAGLRLFAIPNQKKQINDYEIVIPKLASLILTHSFDGKIKGIKEWEMKDQPPVTLVFWSFRFMVAIGFSMIMTSILGMFLYCRKKLFNTRWFQMWCIVMTPSGFISILTGWFVSEIGRQPYTIYGVLRTSESISSVSTIQVIISSTIFLLVYSFILLMALHYITSIIRKGPKIENKKILLL